MVHTDRARWVAERRKGIGASDVAAVLGLTRWESEFGLWLTKTGRRPDMVDTYPMERGRRLEAAVAQWFADETGLALCATGTWALEDAPHLRCNPDRFTSDGGGLEVKTAGEDWSGQWDGGFPALHAQAQALYSLAITGLPHWYVAALTDEAFRWWKLSATGQLADPRWCQLVPGGDAVDVMTWIIQNVDAWWHDCVLGDQVPDVDGSDATRTALHEAYPDVLRPSVVVPGAAKLQAIRLQLKSVMKRAEKHLLFVENVLKAGLEDADTAVDEVDGELRSIIRRPVYQAGTPQQFRRFVEVKA
ncbi:YqaJ viral recombinase family protein [Dactylosporangium sp. CS-033363]|uniref:YqaJ viral recombinase family nuclease n=1 Tax=Dactylosporangium sp. CS-033363 TaxID=3239935 RepID=UPI003D8B60A3